MLEAVSCIFSRAWRYITLPSDLEFYSQFILLPFAGTVTVLLLEHFVLRIVLAKDALINLNIRRRFKKLDNR